jgi:GNAT superfamily N-acetyltransferase
LRELPPASHLFVAEDEDGDRVGFLHLQTQKDFFTGALNCHIADLVVATERDGQGIGSALVRFAEAWAKEHRCRHVTLAVFRATSARGACIVNMATATKLVRMAKPVK